MPSPSTRQSGETTKAAAQRIATELFISRGYDATSLREIADRLGIKKASLYYHFESKEAIVASLVATRAAELQELVEWVVGQPPEPDLGARAVRRWISEVSDDKVRGIRFVLANPALLRRLGGPDRFGWGFTAVVRAVLGAQPDPVAEDLLTMAFLSLHTAILADPGATRSDLEIVRGAGLMADALLAQLGDEAHLASSKRVGACRGPESGRSTRR